MNRTGFEGWVKFDQMEWGRGLQTGHIRRILMQGLEQGVHSVHPKGEENGEVIGLAQE